MGRPVGRQRTPPRCSHSCVSPTPVTALGLYSLSPGARFRQPMLACWLDSDYVSVTRDRTCGIIPYVFRSQWDRIIDLGPFSRALGLGVTMVVLHRARSPAENRTQTAGVGVSGGQRQSCQHRTAFKVGGSPARPEQGHLMISKRGNLCPPPHPTPADL